MTPRRPRFPLGVPIGPAGLAAAGLAALTACAPVERAPAIPLYGAYFPSWIFCALIGIVGTVVIRGVFIKIGLDDLIPWRVIFYLALAISLGLASSLYLFGR